MVVCMYGYFNVWMCVCMGFVKFGCVYLWVMYFAVVCMNEFFLSGCVYVWVL